MVPYFWWLPSGGTSACGSLSPKPWDVKAGKHAARFLKLKVAVGIVSSGIKRLPKGVNAQKPFCRKSFLHLSRSDLAGRDFQAVTMVPMPSSVNISSRTLSGARPSREGDFFDAGPNGGHRAIHLGNHSLVNDAVCFSVCDLADFEARDDAVRAFGVMQQAGHIAHEDQAPGVGDGGLGGGNVGIAVIDFAVFAAGGRTDDGSDALAEAIQQWRGVDADNFTT